MSGFVHLHVHSEFSLLDGLAQLPELCQTAKDSGMESLALTDHGQMYGMIKFHRAAKDAGIKPIYGCEVYQAPRSRLQQETRQDGQPFHLILLAENMTGYRNLLQLVTRANLEGFYYKPRVDKELLAEYAEGLICLTACIAGLVPSLLNEGNVERARHEVGWFKDVFGPDRFYLELQRHAGVPELERINPQMVALAHEFGLRCVATNDVHYVKRSQAAAQDLLLAVQTNKMVSDTDRMRMGSDDYFLASPEEMAQLLPEYPEALENSVRIAEMCNVELATKGYHLPHYEVPNGQSAEEYLRALSEAGLQRRYPEITPEIRQRMEYELGVIHKMGFDDYFLVNYDVVNWAKNEAHMLVGPGRGSGASSIVAYSLGITDLEPLGLGLLFERFLNPGRITMPDIDLDYPDDRRQEVIDYITQRYGKDHTSQIATFGTLGAKGALKDVGRALGIPLSDVNAVTRLIPNTVHETLEKALEEVPELRELYETQPYVKKLIDASREVEGVSRHLSTHAAGVLIADQPLVNYTPLQTAPRGEGIIAQFCMEDVEAIGLLKLDVLGLSTMTALDRTFRWVERTTGQVITQQTIPMDDPDTYALLCTSDVTGVFQVESPGMRRVLRDLQPSNFLDIVALISLYRPGPMPFIKNYCDRKFGREAITYRHPALEPILAETYGVLVYQEQVIRIALELAGYTAAEGDLMRRAVGKKKREVLEAQRANFVAGAQARGIPAEAAEGIFSDIVPFAEYGFNKAHAAGYAVITMQTAYLKAHHPVEFMAALLSVESGNLEKVGLLIAECRRLGVEVRTPDVNASDVDFSIERADSTDPSERSQLLGHEPLAIRYGLGAIKNVGHAAARQVVEARGDRPFADLDDFLQRVDLRSLNKRVLESLISAGALDSLGDRSTLLSSVDQMLATSQERHRAMAVGQRSLFDVCLPGTGPSEAVKLFAPSVGARNGAAPLPQKQLLAAEKDLLGTYMSAHPLSAYANILDERLTAIAEIDISLARSAVQVLGVLSSVRNLVTKKGDTMAFAQLADLTGMIELTLFPRVYEQFKPMLVEDAVLLVDAKVDDRGEKAQLLVDAVSPYEPPANAPRRSQVQEPVEGVTQARSGASPRAEPQPPPHAPAPAARRARRLLVEVPLDADAAEGQRAVQELYDLLAAAQGDVPFCFRLSNRAGSVQVDFPEVRTAYSAQLHERIDALLGPNHLKVDWS